MKKITLLAAAGIVAFSFSSCKKEYTCECSGAGYPTTTVTAEFKKKKDAESWCNVSTTTAGSTYSCKLK